ncbi:MAG: hypothetical protein C4B55_06070 [Candidatus Methanophagaceae archaeon]|nr:MAG: hypothetical protein C4B55_06070 [Methanophagales archaeon]
MATIIGKVLRVLPLKEVRPRPKAERTATERTATERTAEQVSGGETKKIVDLIISDEFDYRKVSFWEEYAELVARGKIKTGDVLKIENAWILSSEKQAAEKRANVGRFTRVTKISREIDALSRADYLRQNLTVLAVARPEKRGRVCVAGVTENGEWVRPQDVYEADTQNFKNLCVSKVYLDAWRGRRARKEDRFFVCGEGVGRELSEDEKRAFLEQNLDDSVDAVFKSGKQGERRSLGLIKPRILRVHEEVAKSGKRGKAEGREKEGRGKSGKGKKERVKSHEQYLRFNFKDGSGRTYRGWSCRCDDFYKAWNDLKQKHRWTYGWRMLWRLRRSETYLVIGLTFSDYGVERLEYGAYPMIVGVHSIKNQK